jgi:hypothetical protein
MASMNAGDDPPRKNPEDSTSPAGTVHGATAGRRKTYKLAATAPAMSAQLGKVTEVRIVNTAFGPAKLQEATNDKRFLVMRALIEGAGLVPYIDRDMIGGAYCVALDRAMTLGPGVMRYPVLDVVPAMFLDQASRQRIAVMLQSAGLNLRFPEDVDLTVSVREDLARGALLWKNPAATAFTLETFLDNLLSVRASPQFERVYLIEMADGARHVMAVERSLQSVVELHPYFERLDQQAAVRVRFRDSADTWIAPLPGGG